MEERIILLGHGSPKEDANKLGVIASMLHGMIHQGCKKSCVEVSYLQFANPGVIDTITKQVSDGAKKIILHPFFLNSGMHVTKDIPELIEEARKRFPGVEFIYTEPLGVHEKLAEIVVERIGSAAGVSKKSVDFSGLSEKLLPEEIEKRSFEILSTECDLSNIPADRLPIVKRVIHATADFEFAKTLVFHPEAVAKGIKAIREGKNILTDIEMVRSGISKQRLSKWGGSTICAVSDEEVARISKETECTRAEIAIERNINNNIGIVAIGNAPTALLRAIDLLKGAYASGNCDIPLVIGVPVGFVKAFESKTLLAEQEFPFITNLSRKGGTPVAAAIVNALLIIAGEDNI